MELEENGFVFSDDPKKIDPKVIHNYLSTKSYWAENIPLELVKKSIENSLCFGVYEETRQVGFARWITDRATFAYLADVYIDETYRGKSLSKKLMSFMLSHQDLQGLRRYMLATNDAHGLYAQFGFKAIDQPDKLMAIIIPDMYKNH